MHETRRTANLLGATALAVSDLALARLRRSVGVSASAAGALVVLVGEPNIGVTELGRRIGLSQSAAARMLDSLELADLAKRRPADGRGVSVAVTSAGRRAAARLLAAREEVLTGLLSELDPAEQEMLAGLLAKLLARLYAQVGSSELLCRLCDRTRCTSHAVCPVGQAERDRGA
jgi:DNA-binding MarR family transcriptional regulator